MQLEQALVIFRTFNYDAAAGVLQGHVAYGQKVLDDMLEILTQAVEQESNTDKEVYAAYELMKLLGQKRENQGEAASV